MQVVFCITSRIALLVTIRYNKNKDETMGGQHAA